MFLTWHPFRIKTWTQLCEANAIVSACIEHSKRLFDTDDDEEARRCVDMSVAEEELDDILSKTTAAEAERGDASVSTGVTRSVLRRR
jgi:Na+/phosphate symporter